MGCLRAILAVMTIDRLTTAVSELPAAGERRDLPAIAQEAIDDPGVWHLVHDDRPSRSRNSTTRRHLEPYGVETAVRGGRLYIRASK